MIATLPPQKIKLKDGIRRVNIETDLAPLADLIEIAFNDTMDESGRAAIREMRYMSRLGMGLRLLSRLNDLVIGISQGYVAIVDGKLVGNVSVYPARWREEVGSAWLVANVSTHPDYRKRGIARSLMTEVMRFIRKKGATDAILQVDYDNRNAIHLYESLGFHKERPFTKWRRSGLVSSPMKNHDLDDIFFTKPRRSDWQAEYDLAQVTRPNKQGGIGWLRPIHVKDFRPSVWRSIVNAFSFGDQERLIVRDEHHDYLHAALWTERSLALSRTKLTLFQHPHSDRRYLEALLSNILRRYRSSSFMVEHPHDDASITDLLDHYRFTPRRTVWHMRYTY